MKKLLMLAMLTGTFIFGQVSIGVQIGPPPPPRVIHSRPHNPGPGYVWVDGYWYPVRGRYVWHDGYYTRPPYGGAAWVGPRYEGHQFFEGHWGGGGREVPHDHNWDKDKHNRDYDRSRDHH